MKRNSPREARNVPVHLPALLTATIGRAREVAALVALLREEGTRLVTLTGPGGVGKTRLSLEVAGELRTDFADGVFFVSLAPLLDQGQVLLAIAQAVGIEENSSQGLERSLCEYLRNKHCLLLLDNCEHLLRATGLVAELLAHAPRLTVLATSREMLHLYGEREIIVPPLTLPDLTRPAGAEESEALNLFVERARAARPDFVVSKENWQTIAEICVQLDGLPLAIELAAARSKLLSPPAILARLGHRLTLLTGGAHNLPERQRTLRNTLDWSYGLLCPEEQRFFRRLGVFTGTWTLEAAEAVAGAGDLDPLFLLTSLVDKSLVNVVEQTPTETRFLLLETIREYALVCLKQQHEEKETCRHHARLYLRLAEDIGQHLRGSGQREGLQRLDRESANIWAALRWSIEQNEATLALRLAGALYEYLPLRSSLSDGRQWFEEVLTMEGTQEAGKARTRVYYGAGVLAYMRSDLKLARTRLTESKELAQQIDDHHTLALALGMLAQLELYPGNYATARELAQEGLHATEWTHDSWCRGILHRIYGIIACKQGDFTTASTRYALSLMLLREVGDQRNEAETLVNLGAMMRLRGKLRSAHYLYARGLQLLRECGDRWGQLTCLNGMGEALWVQGNYLQAIACFEESLALATLLGDRSERATALTGLGQIARCMDQQARAAQYLKEALHLTREINSTQGLVMALGGLGDLKRIQGDWSGASHYYKQGLEMAQATGNKLMMISLLCGMGDVARSQGKDALACAQLKQSLHLAWEMGNQEALTAGMEALAWLCVQAGQPEHGALLLGAATNLREALQTPHAPVYRAGYARDLAALQEILGQKAFSECWTEGRSLLLKHIMALAVAPVHIAETPARSREKRASAPYSLTARELDVLRLLSEGHADARIAKILVVSPRTVNTHLRSIYAKLGVSSRSAATRIAIDQKLV